MPVYRDYETRINLNELVEQRIPVCNSLHPDHCLTEEQVDQIAHDIRSNIDLSPIYQQVDETIEKFVNLKHIEI